MSETTGTTAVNTSAYEQRAATIRSDLRADIGNFDKNVYSEAYIKSRTNELRYDAKKKMAALKEEYISNFNDCKESLRQDALCCTGDEGAYLNMVERCKDTISRNKNTKMVTDAGLSNDLLRAIAFSCDNAGDERAWSYLLDYAPTTVTAPMQVYANFKRNKFWEMYCFSLASI